MAWFRTLLRVYNSAPLEGFQTKKILLISTAAKIRCNCDPAEIQSASLPTCESGQENPALFPEVSREEDSTSWKRPSRCRNRKIWEDDEGCSWRCPSHWEDKTEPVHQITESFEEEQSPGKNGSTRYRGYWQRNRERNRRAKERI